MTKREGAVFSIFTGILCCEDFSTVHEYIEDIMGRPVLTHEIPMIEKELKERSKEEFFNIVSAQT